MAHPCGRSVLVGHRGALPDEHNRLDGALDHRAGRSERGCSRTGRTTGADPCPGGVRPDRRLRGRSGPSSGARVNMTFPPDAVRRARWGIRSVRVWGAGGCTCMSGPSDAAGAAMPPVVPGFLPSWMFRLRECGTVLIGPQPPAGEHHPWGANRCDRGSSRLPRA
jgi:hypothetical protein